MASKATTKARQHLRDACTDELTNFVGKKNIFYDEWQTIVSKIEMLAYDYDFQAIDKLDKIIKGIEPTSDIDLSDDYEKLGDSLSSLETVLKYDNFTHGDN